nr:chromosome partition protein Smc-like [Aegilops tauschii subsp. strangulata]
MPGLYGCRPKKPRGTTAATKRDEAAAKALRFRKPVKTPQLVSAAPLTLERADAASIMESAEGPAATRRIDPAADLRQAKEQNAREARAEQEAARLAKAVEEKAEASAMAKLAATEAAAKAKARERAEEASRRQTAQFVVPLRSAPPPPEFRAPTGGAGGQHSAMERESGDVVPSMVIVLPSAPVGESRDKQPADLPAPPIGREVAAPTPRVRAPLRRRLVKAASLPRPPGVSTASSSIPNAEASSAVPVGWVRGGGTGPLNTAILDVQAKLQAEADALKRCNNAFLESRGVVREYHNLRAHIFNSKVQELTQRTADLAESREAKAALQQQLGEARTALHAKEAECSKLAEERDRLVTQLAEQAKLLKKAHKEAEDKETSLLAQFATERAAWTDRELMLTSGFHEVEDIVDDFFPGHSNAANQAIEVSRERRRAEGAKLAADAPRPLNE